MKLCDYIERYLKRLIEQAEDGVLVVQRNELAGKFRCVPSQINYVLETRFTPERGYIIESRRGGGGFIKITRVQVGQPNGVLKLLKERIGDMVSQREAENLLMRLEEEGFLTSREALIMRAALSREALTLDLPTRDLLRANLLKAMVIAALRYPRAANA